MKFIYLLIVFFISFLDVNAQNKVSNRKLRELFKIDNGNNLKVWSICNSNSNDTVELYSNTNYFYQSNSCCVFSEWEFYKKNKFCEKFLKVCNEPATSKVITEKGYYTIKIVKENRTTYLSKNFKGKTVVCFKVIEITEISLPKENDKKCKIIRMIISKTSH